MEVDQSNSQLLTPFKKDVNLLIKTSFDGPESSEQSSLWLQYSQAYLKTPANRQTESRKNKSEFVVFDGGSSQNEMYRGLSESDVKKSLTSDKKPLSVTRKLYESDGVLENLSDDKKEEEERNESQKGEQKKIMKRSAYEKRDLKSGNEKEHRSKEQSQVIESYCNGCSFF